MPVMIPVAAFAPMLTDAITLTAYTRAGSGGLVSTRATIAAAHVSAPVTNPLEVGATPAAWKFSVNFPLTSWTDANNPPAPGSEIEPGARWPRLYVEEAAPLGSMWHLVCSAREGA